jgi:hypothetical protein
MRNGCGRTSTWRFIFILLLAAGCHAGQDAPPRADVAPSAVLPAATTPLASASASGSATASASTSAAATDAGVKLGLRGPPDRPAGGVTPMNPASLLGGSRDFDASGFGSGGLGAPAPAGSR